jgi:DNA-binding NarL/FixJ family response regulator
MGRVFLVAQSSGLRAAMSQTIHDQGAGSLHIIGEAGSDSAELAMLQVARPDVVVLVLGFEPVSELGSMQEIHHLAPGSRIVVVDTLGDAQIWFGNGWARVDALLRSEQLATELVPTLRRLVAQRRASSSEGADSHTASAHQE